MSRYTTSCTKSGGAASSTSSAEASLYLHIPFCRSKCRYCDFFSSTETEIIRRVLCAIRTEINRAGENPFFAAKSFSTIYFGGGTPSLLAGADLDDLLSAVRRSFRFSEEPEISLEANPDRFKVPGGVNRLVLGVQSFQQSELRILGRTHDAAAAEAAFGAARASGLSNIGLDLLIGIPGQSTHSWRNTLDRALKLGPEHISIYFLTLEPGVPLARELRKGGLEQPPDEEQRSWYMEAKAVLERAGYEHYEIANFARASFRCRHNENYWNGTPYLGIGPSAHSFDGERRWWNIADLQRYYQLVEGGDTPAAGEERLTANDRLIELIMLGLRRREGFSITAAERLYDGDFQRAIARAASALGGVDGSGDPFSSSARDSVLTRRDDTLCLTGPGLVMADEICARLAAAVT